MSRTLLWPCYRCSRHTDVRRLRFLLEGGERIFVCSNCYADLVYQHVTNGEAKPQLSNELSHRQEDLPF